MVAYTPTLAAVQKAVLTMCAPPCHHRTCYGSKAFLCNCLKATECTVSLQVASVTGAGRRSDICNQAGNTMSIPCIGSMFLSVFLCGPAPFANQDILPEWNLGAAWWAANARRPESLIRKAMVIASNGGNFLRDQADYGRMSEPDDESEDIASGSS